MGKVLQEENDELLSSDPALLGSGIDYEVESKQDKLEIAGVSIYEYRRMFGDNISTDDQIIRRLQYLEASCRNVIRGELQRRGIQKEVSKNSLKI